MKDRLLYETYINALYKTNRMISLKWECIGSAQQKAWETVAAKVSAVPSQPSQVL
jgi:hypothetical protein